MSASSASAAATTVNVSCSGSAGPLSFSPSTITANTNDTITLSVQGPWVFNVAATGATGPSTASGLGGGPYTWTVTGSSGGSLTLSFASGVCNAPNATFTFSGTAPAPSGGGSALAPVVQEFGLPASGTCAAAASKDLNWAGVASGGWAVSWGQWMNGGKGGAVCTRTLVYSTQAAAWTVAS